MNKKINSPVNNVIASLHDCSPGSTKRMTKEAESMLNELLSRVNSKELTTTCYPTSETPEFIVNINLDNPAFDSFIRSLYDRFVDALFDTNKEVPFTLIDWDRYVRTYIVSRVRYVQGKHPGLRHAKLRPIVKYNEAEIWYPSELHLVLCAIGRAEHREYNVVSTPVITGETNSSKEEEAVAYENLMTFGEMVTMARQIKFVCKRAGMQIASGYLKQSYTLPAFATIEHDVNEDGTIYDCNTKTPNAAMIEPSLVFICNILGTSGISSIMPTAIAVFSHKTAMYSIDTYTSYFSHDYLVFRSDS